MHTYPRRHPNSPNFACSHSAPATHTNCRPAPPLRSCRRLGRLFGNIPQSRASILSRHGVRRILGLPRCPALASIPRKGFARARCDRTRRAIRDGRVQHNLRDSRQERRAPLGSDLTIHSSGTIIVPIIVRLTQALGPTTDMTDPEPLDSETPSRPISRLATPRAMLIVFAGLSLFFSIFFSLIRGPHVSDLKFTLLVFGLSATVTGVSFGGGWLMYRCADTGRT